MCVCHIRACVYHMYVRVSYGSLSMCVCVRVCHMYVYVYHMCVCVCHMCTCVYHMCVCVSHVSLCMCVSVTYMCMCITCACVSVCVCICLCVCASRVDVYTCQCVVRVIHIFQKKTSWANKYFFPGLRRRIPSTASAKSCLFQHPPTSTCVQPQRNQNFECPSQSLHLVLLPKH